MEQLSEHFCLLELTKSSTAERLGLDNTPDADQIEALRSLCIHVLQPLREAVGAIHVNSGYRSPKVNGAVGGVPSSQHTKGQAADIECATLSNLDLAKYVVDSGIVFDEVILEYYTPGIKNSGWVHVSYREGFNRGNVLTKIKGQAGYAEGLVA